MNIQKILPFLLFVLLVSSCRKDQGKGFEISYLVTIEADAGLTPILTHNYTLHDLYTDIQNKLILNNVTLSQVTSIQAKLLTMDLINPAGATYDFLNKAYLKVSADGLTEVRIGYQEFIPNDVGSRLTFIPSPPNLIEYLTQEKFNLTLALLPEVSPAFSSTNRIQVVFQVYIEE